MTTLRRTSALPLCHSSRPGLQNVLRRWYVQRRTRRALARLTPHLLADIGLTQNAARCEAKKPYWQD